MTDNPTDDPPGVRVMTDGGQERFTKTVTADTVVQREVRDEDVEMLRVPISSTRPDREGDRFTKEALSDMAEQIEQEQPHVFDNHGMAGGFMSAIPYDSRETIGAQMTGEVEKAEDGEHELFAFVNPDGSHPEGERMIKQVRDEMQPIKFSVGFRVMGYQDVEDEAGNVVGREFTSADLMETSRVGIPANADASVQMAAKGNGMGQYPMHPMFGRAPEARADGGREEVQALRTEVDRLHERFDELRDGSDSDPEETDAEKAECPECGEDLPDGADYCPNCGEELGEKEDDEDDDDDDDDEEESSVSPERVEELESELSEMRAALNEGTASPESADTDTTAAADVPGEQSDTDPEETDDSTDPDEQADGDGSNSVFANSER